MNRGWMLMSNLMVWVVGRVRVVQVEDEIGKLTQGIIVSLIRIMLLRRDPMMDVS